MYWTETVQTARQSKLSVVYQDLLDFGGDEFYLVSEPKLVGRPFAQALINLFVDTSDRGVDSYPDRTLARNPWVNFVKYEDEVADKLVELGRENLFQPDAGSGPRRA